jgi:hypothetical protein
MSPPDLNSLPPSRSMASSPNQPRAMATAVSSPPDRHDSPSPRLSNSLAATASMNAADLSRRSSASRGSPRQPRLPSERRRSQNAMTLSLADPTLPGPGEMSTGSRRASQSYSTTSPSTLGGNRTIATGDPHHHQRQPSLGDIHNELEQEQEAQVNRMLQLIRDQQLQLDALRHSQRSDDQHHHSRRSSQQNSAMANTAIDDLTPASERSISFPSIHPALPGANQPLPRRSRNPSSANRSPALRPTSTHHDSSGFDWPPSPLENARRNSLRDESAYYQAETSALTRENQMLRARIRELEKQVNELNHVPANTPARESNLMTSPPLEAQEELGESSGLAEKL